MEISPSLNNQKIPKRKPPVWRAIFKVILFISLGLNAYFLLSWTGQGDVIAETSNEISEIGDALQMEPASMISPPATSLDTKVEKLEVQQASFTSTDHFNGEVIQVLHFKVRNSLNYTVCRSMTRTGGCQLMSAYMARILMWFFDINSSMRNGDTIGLVYKQVDGEEHFRILKLVYKSQHFSETFEANFYRKTGNPYGAYFDRAGKEIARRIEMKQSPIRDYMEITSLPGDFRKGTRGHSGTDFKAEVGTPIFATFEGKVLRRNWNVRNNGYCLELDHPGQGIKTRYLHLSRVLVKPGQYVKQGQQIAESGNTGRTLAPHLHYEILSRDKRKKIYSPFKFKHHKTYYRELAGQAHEDFEKTVRLYDSVFQES